MDEDLKNILTKYRACTLQIEEIVQADNLDSLPRLIEERQDLVDKALSSTCDKVKMKQIYKDLKLNELQGELNALMSKKLSLIRDEMEKIVKSKKANILYNKGNYNNSKIFSKKI